MIKGLVRITKEEKEKLIEKYPETHIARTMRQCSKRHHYYCEESSAVLRLLEKIRGREQKASSYNKS